MEVNIITVQDEVIRTMGKVALTNRNFATVQTKAARKARRVLDAAGLDMATVDRAIWDALDVANLNRLAAGGQQ